MLARMEYWQVVRRPKSEKMMHTKFVPEKKQDEKDLSANTKLALS